MTQNSDEMIKKDIEDALNSNKGPEFARFALSALSGLVPFAGGVISGIGGFWSDKEQEKINELFKAWLKIQEEELQQIGITLTEVLMKLDLTDEKIERRIKSKEYSELVKKCFRDWSAGDSEEKRKLLRNLLLNAASCALTSDDVIKMFIEWIGRYNEIHFKIISIIYRSEAATRHEIWQEIYGNRVREDSAEADLFKLIIQDLSMGHVIRQFRETDRHGNFIKKSAPKPSTKNKAYVPTTLKSAFDNEQDYVLTELGRQFVHYTMNDIVTKIEAPE